MASTQVFHNEKKIISLFLSLFDVLSNLFNKWTYLIISFFHLMAFMTLKTIVFEKKLLLNFAPH